METRTGDSTTNKQPYVELDHEASVSNIHTEQDNLKQPTEPHSSQHESEIDENSENVEMEVVSHNAHSANDQDDGNSSLKQQAISHDEHHVTTQPVVTTTTYEGINLNNDDDDVKDERHEDKFSAVRPDIRRDHETETKEQISTNNVTDDVDDDEDENAPFLTTDPHKSVSGSTSDIDRDPPQSSVFRKDGFNYWRVLFVTFITFSIGYLIYIVTALGWVIVLCTGIGLSLSIAYECIRKYKSNNTTDSTQEAEEEGAVYDLNEVFESVWDKDEQNCGIYVSTDFSNDYIEVVETKNAHEKKRKRKVSVTGSTRVYHKNGNGAILLEKRALYIFEDYQGYEMIGGVSSLGGLLITVCVQIVKLIIKWQSGDSIDWFMNILILIFITVVGACIGCIIEIELRKSNKLPPNKELFMTSTTIALHEIISIDRYSIGYHQNLKSNLKSKSSTLFVQKVAIKWFQCLLGVLRFFQYIFMALFVNTAFVLFVWIFILVCLLFELAINKEASVVPNLSVIIMIMLWISVVIGLFAMYYTSQSVDRFDAEYITCMEKRIDLNRLSMTNRIAKETQFCLFILFGISALLWFVSSILMSAVVSNIKAIDIASSDHQEASTRIFDYMVCNINADIGSNMSHTDTHPMSIITTTAAPYTTANNSVNASDVAIDSASSRNLCDSPNVEFVMSSLVFVCATLYLMSVAAYVWRQNDKHIFKFDAKRVFKREWEKYSAIKIGLKSSKTSSHFWRNNSREIIIELDKFSAKTLHDYLNDGNIVPWFAKNENATDIYNYQTR